jgi:cytochrome P450
MPCLSCCYTTCALLCVHLQGGSQDASDMELMLETLAYRVLAPVPVWKILPDRQLNAATKRFDALITGLIAQEKARLAAAGMTDSSTITTGTTDTDEVTDTSGVKGSCLLTQLVQYGIAIGAATDAGASTTAGDKGMRALAMH